MRVYGQSAVILDRPGCVGFELAPGVEAQAAELVPQSFNDSVILRAEHEIVIGIASDTRGDLEQML